MNKIVRVDRLVARLVSYGAMCACLFTAQKTVAQTANYQIIQPFTASTQTDPFPPAGWSSTPVADGSPNDNNSGWRFSVLTKYGTTDVGSATTYNNGNLLFTPNITNAKRINFRFCKAANDATDSKIYIEYALSTAPTTFLPFDSITNNSSNTFNFNSTSGTNWKLFSRDLSGISGTYQIRFRDSRPTTANTHTASARFIDSLYVASPVSIDTTYFRTRADGNFSNYANWSYWDGEFYQNAALNVIPLSTNHVIIKNLTVLDTNYTTGAGRTLRDSTTGSTFTITPGKRYSVSASGTADFGGQLVTVQSNASGAGKIGQISGTLSATNMTVERYIPAKPTRKWSFLSSPFGSQTVRNGWQQQIFITGSGTGGTPCGAGTGNGGASDQYNSNGFDDTQNDPSSMDYYANTVSSNGTRWTQISGTGISYTRGLGYRVNVRGDRTVANACADQINYSGAAPATSAVTLKTNGSYSTTATTSLNTSSSIANTLLGNPYPCELSFAAFYTTNSGSIANKAWVYASNTSNTSDLYSAWNAGQVTNAQFLPSQNLAGSSPNYTDLIIPTGGAFFIERASGGTSVNFLESHKSTTIASGNGILSKTTLIPWTDFVRARLQTQADTVNDLDNIIVRYSDDSSVSNTAYGSLDGYSFNPATATIASLKGTSRMAIQTRVRTLNADTVNLFVGYTAGSYRMKFDQFENFTNLDSIYLLDYFLNTATSIKNVNFYDFNITSNSLSQGGNRFALAFSFTSTPLAMQFIAVGAKSLNKGAAVNFTVGNESDVNSYSVERSDDGATFYTTSTIKATKAGSYIVTDNKELTAATTLYRIKATDLNGKYAYSPVVKLNQAANNTKIALYPNPVLSDLSISLTGGTIKGNYTLKIMNVEGAVVMEQSGATQQYINISTNQLQSGIYFVKMTFDNGDVTVERFVKK